MNIRAIAARIIFRIVVDGRSLSDLLPEEQNKITDPRDRALLQAICFGVCRWYFRLNSILQKLLEKPLKQKDLDIHMLMLVGIYQLMDMRIPPYAAVSETVSAVKSFKKLWAKNLVNGVLRQYQRDADDLKNIDNFSHPRWMIERIKKDYPDNWESILNANNQHPPFSLRVNQQRISREKYLEKVKADIISETTSGIVLQNATDVQQVPGFAEGDVSVQDGAAQLAAELLQCEAQQRILDACAAPGGKTGHILEIQPDVTCIAIDKDETRLSSVKENLQRLNLSAICLANDVCDTKTWWDGKLFDRILLDAPCSGSGVIRRHPDIKLLRISTDIAEFAKEQLRILQSIWPVLKPDGLLVYATCSIFPEENNDVLKKFIAEQPDAKEEKLAVSWGMAREIGRQILPGMHGMDGFYYACLRKYND